MLVELGASLDLVKWDNDILEENDVFVSQRNGEPTDDTGKDIKKFCSTVKFVGLVDEGEEAFVDGLSNHLSSWHQFGVELVKDVLQVVSLNRFLGIEEFKEFLDKLWSNVNLE